MHLGIPPSRIFVQWSIESRVQWLSTRQSPDAEARTPPGPEEPSQFRKGSGPGARRDGPKAFAETHPAPAGPSEMDAPAEGGKARTEVLQTSCGVPADRLASTSG